MSGRNSETGVWLNAMYVSRELQTRIEHERTRLNTALGCRLPKAEFMRMLLDAGLEQIAKCTWGGSNGRTVLPSAPARGVVLAAKRASKRAARRPKRGVEKHAK